MITFIKYISHYSCSHIINPSKLQMIKEKNKKKDDTYFPHLHCVIIKIEIEIVRFK